MRGCLGLVMTFLLIVLVLAVAGFGWELGEHFARVIL